MTASSWTRLTAWAAGFALVSIVSASSVEPSRVALVPDPNTSNGLRLKHWPAGGWQVQQFEQFVEIRFPGVDLVIEPAEDLAEHLSRHVADLQSETTGDAAVLRLTLNCGCSVSLQGDPQSGLSIEILGSVARPSPNLQIGAAPGPAPDWAPAPVPKHSGGAAVAGRDGAVDVEEARKRLMEQLLRAAEAGLVDLEADPASAATEDLATSELLQPEHAEGEAEGQSHAAEAEINDDHRAMPESEHPNGNATTSTPETDHDGADGATHEDVAVTVLEDAPEPRAPEPKCFENEVFELPEVGMTETLAERIAEHRRSLVGEFDHPDAGSALALVKTYLAAGLGTEARAVLETFIPDHNLTPIYREMSLLLDGAALSENASVAKSECLGDQALWRSFAAARSGDGTAAVRDEIASGRAIERLPVRVRQLIAAWIGFAAAKTGEWDVARRMEAMAERSAISGGEVFGRSLLLSARLALWREDHAQAIELLGEARQTDPASADDALLMLGDLALRSEALLGAETSGLRTDLAGLSSTMIGTETAEKAFEFEVRLLDRAASRDEAIALLSYGVEAGLFPQDRHVSLLSSIVSEPTINDLSRPLALIYLDDPGRYESALEQPGFRRALIQSMARLGLPSLAKPIFRSEDAGDSSIVAPLSQAYLDADDPREALELANHLPEGPEKHRLIGAALLANGQAGQAKGHLAASAADIAADEDERLARLENHIRGALADGDLETALNAAAQQLMIAQDPDLAERAALLALEAGHSEIPPPVVEVLQEKDRQRLAGLELLFAGPLNESAVEDPTAVASYLESLDAEMALIEELLGDG